jgi:hypothetical protein
MVLNKIEPLLLINMSLIVEGFELQTTHTGESIPVNLGETMVLQALGTMIITQLWLQGHGKRLDLLCLFHSYNGSFGYTNSTSNKVKRLTRLLINIFDLLVC